MFKKNILLIFISISIIFINSISFASICEIYCAQDNHKKTFSGNISSLSGFNFLARNIIEKQIEKILKKELQSNFNVKLKTFYGNNLKNGEFSSLSIKTKKLYFNNFYMRDLEIKTLCDYNKISFSNNNILFNENMVLKYSAKINQEDIDKLKNSGAFEKLINKMNKDKRISSLIKIVSMDVKIKENNLVLEYYIIPNLKYDIFSISNIITKPIKITFNTDLKVENGIVKVSNIKSNSKNSKYEIFAPILNTFNITTKKLKFDKQNNGKIYVDKIDIINSIIILEGKILIYKNR